MKDDLLAVIITVADYAEKQGLAIPADIDTRITLAGKSQHYYEKRLMVAVRRRYEQETNDGEFLAVFAFLIAQQLRRGYSEGLREAGIDEMEVKMQNELAALIIEEENHARDLLKDIQAAILAGLGWIVFQNRMALWANRYLEVRNRAVVSGGIKRELNLRWELGATEKHCTDCSGYAGQVRSAQEWDDLFRVHGHKPQSRELECRGYRCDCRLEVA